MDLAAWLAKEGYGSKSRLVRALGVAYTTVHDIERGKSTPRAETARAIEEATGGEVTAAELLGIAPPHHDSEAA